MHQAKVTHRQEHACKSSTYPCRLRKKMEKQEDSKLKLAVMPSATGQMPPEYNRALYAASKSQNYASSMVGDGHSSPGGRGEAVAMRSLASSEDSDLPSGEEREEEKHPPVSIAGMVTQAVQL